MHPDKTSRGLVSKWAVNQPREENAAKISEQRRELWQALNQFVMERGGAIVSPMFAFPVRLEVATDSGLPERLRELGYDLIYRNEETRVGPPVSEPRRWRQRPRLAIGYGFRTVDVFELGVPR